jgi:CheY-like chemotaxis protein
MLVAEDRAEDIEILKLAFKKAQVHVTLRFVQNGAEVIDYLKGEGRFANRAEYPMPRLLLLDLKMPLKNGFDVLEWLRSEPGLRRLLVIVFTSSDLPHDIDRAFDLGANAYLLKPGKFERLQEIARALDAFWFKLNRFPNCAYGDGFTDPTWETL